MSALTPLATFEDLNTRAELEDAERDRAEVTLIDASAAVRDEAGQVFNLTDHAAWLKVKNGMVRLPQRPVVEILEVTDANGNVLSYTWRNDDRLWLSTDALNAWELQPYRTSLGEVHVTYKAGYEEIPDLVVAVVCNTVLRAMGRDPGDGSLTQESIEGYSYQAGSTGAAGPVGLLPEEKLRLRSFTRMHASSYQGV